MSENPTAASGSGKAAFSQQVKLVFASAVIFCGVAMAAAMNPRMIQLLVVSIAIFWAMMFWFALSSFFGSIRKGSGERFVGALVLMAAVAFCAEKSHAEAVWIAKNLRLTPHDIWVFLSSAFDSVKQFVEGVLRGS